MSTDWKQKPKPEPVPQQEPQYTPIWMSVMGWIISLLPFAGVAAMMTLMKPDEGAMDNGWKAEAMTGLMILQIVGAVLYLFPYTAVLGAIILTGYLGGAIATHVRIGDAFGIPAIFIVLLWLGLVFRDARLRAMLPVRGLSMEPAGPSGCLSFIGVCLLALILVVGIVIGISHALPAEYRVARSKTIDAPPAQVFPHVADFNKWKAWNPFIEGDPNIQITIEGKPGEVGSVYKWSGSKGSGSMKITEIVPNERVKIQLDFEAPLKHSSDAEFKFKDEKDKTVVTWSNFGESDSLHKAIRGVMPMDMLLGAEFNKGLEKMKTAVESSSKAPQPEKTSLPN